MRSAQGYSVAGLGGTRENRVGETKKVGVTSVGYCGHTKG